MSSSPPRLVVRHGPNPNQEFTLAMKTSIVGREPINDVVFSDPEVSRRHARIILQLDQYYIEDLGSTNGTFVNGRRIDKVTRLSHGDIIDLGESVRLTFLVDNEDQAQIARTPKNLTSPKSQLVESSNGLAAPVIVESVLAEDPVDLPEAQDETDEIAQGWLQNLTRRPMYMGIGCALLLFLACSCGTAIWLLDSYAPELLYGIFP